jgi:hypothetical protein
LLSGELKTTSQRGVVPTVGVPIYKRPHNTERAENCHRVAERAERERAEAEGMNGISE